MGKLFPRKQKKKEEENLTSFGNVDSISQKEGCVATDFAGGVGATAVEPPSVALVVFEFDEVAQIFKKLDKLWRRIHIAVNVVLVRLIFTHVQNAKLVARRLHFLLGKGEEEEQRETKRGKKSHLEREQFLGEFHRIFGVHKFALFKVREQTTQTFGSGKVLVKVIGREPRKMKAIGAERQGRKSQILHGTSGANEKVTHLAGRNAEESRKQKEEREAHL